MSDAVSNTVQVNLKFNVHKYLAVKQYAKRHNVTIASLFEKAIDIILGDECRGKISVDVKQCADESNGDQHEDNVSNYDDEWMQITKAQETAHTAVGFVSGSSAINDWLDAITLMIKALIGKRETSDRNKECNL